MKYGYGKFATGQKYRYSKLGGRQCACTECGNYLQGAEMSSGQTVCGDCSKKLKTLRESNKIWNTIR